MTDNDTIIQPQPFIAEKFEAFKKLSTDEKFDSLEKRLQVQEFLHRNRDKNGNASHSIFVDLLPIILISALMGALTYHLLKK